MLPNAQGELLRLYEQGPAVDAGQVHGQRPRDEGLAPAATVYPQELQPGLPEGRRVVDLKDLEKEFVFFNHAVLVLIGGIADPVAVHFDEAGLSFSDRPWLFQFASPVVYGLPEPWGSCVLACPVEHWPGLDSALSAAAGYQPATGLYWESTRQEMPVPSRTDLTSDQAWDCPTSVSVKFYGLSGKEAAVCFVRARPGHHAPLAMRRVVSTDLARRMADLTERLCRRG